MTHEGATEGNTFVSPKTTINANWVFAGGNYRNVDTDEESGSIDTDVNVEGTPDTESVNSETPADDTTGDTDAKEIDKTGPSLRQYQRAIGGRNIFDSTQAAEPYISIGPDDRNPFGDGSSLSAPDNRRDSDERAEENSSPPETSAGSGIQQLDTASIPSEWPKDRLGKPKINKAPNGRITNEKQLNKLRLSDEYKTTIASQLGAGGEVYKDKYGYGIIVYTSYSADPLLFPYNK